MKGTFFNKPLEWNIETKGESWQQGDLIEGHLTVKNHGQEAVDLSETGLALAFADIKKVHARADNALKPEQKVSFDSTTLPPGETKELSFKLPLPENCSVSDKKSSYYLTYGRSFSENHLQLKVEPRELFTRIIGLFDTFLRFKLKDYKSSKTGVEFKLLPPTSREMSNIESLQLNFSLDAENLKMEYIFQVRKLDTAGVTNKLNKETVKLMRELTPRQYSLGKGLLNQETLLKSIEETLAEVKLKSVF